MQYLRSFFTILSSAVTGFFVGVGLVSSFFAALFLVLVYGTGAVFDPNAFWLWIVSGLMVGMLGTVVLSVTRYFLREDNAAAGPISNAGPTSKKPDEKKSGIELKPATAS